MLDELHTDHPGLLRPEVREEFVMLWDSSGAGSGVAREWLEYPDPYVEIANVVQDAAVEALWGEGKSAVWPTCPHHPGGHPLSTAVVTAQAVWVCPTTRETVRPIWA